MEIFKSKSAPIQNIIERSLIISSLFTLAIALIGSVYFNHSGLEMLRENNLRREQQLLSNFLAPAIAISDIMEVRRLLTLASDVNEKFAVIDNSSNILIPDYEDFSLVKQSYLNTAKSTGCSAVKTGFQIIKGKKLWITCSPLVTNDNDKAHNVGILLSYSPYPSLWVSSLLFYFFGLALLSLLINAIWFRSILKKTLLKPLTMLGSKIIGIARSPLNDNTCLDDIENLPYEINEIKNAFQSVLIHLQFEYQQRTESEKKSALLDLAARVAHDMLSPVAAMEMSLHQLSSVISSESMLIMKMAIQSIRDIANNLLQQYRDNQLNKTKIQYDNAVSIDDQYIPRHILLYSLIEEVISQKRFEWLNKKCDLTYLYTPGTKSFWIDIAPGEVKRMISNLLNNAIEACLEKPKIEVLLSEVNNTLELRIVDNGIGMASEMINCFLNGESSKHVGRGFGLSSAKQYMEKIGGRLILTSKIKQGTTVNLNFLSNTGPAWLPDHIHLSQKNTVIVLDDDAAMQALWVQRLQVYPVKLQIFSNYKETQSWIECHINDLNNMVMCIDYDLSDASFNGLMLLKHFNVKNRGYLITSHAEELQIQHEVQTQGIWLIPKVLASDIAIKFM